ncbi:hypothetical protein ACYOEI_03425 [Singulisphaera rosea]
MNFEIEIHDSTLAEIIPEGRDLIFRLAPAYVHASTGRPGIDPGSGWLQDIDLVIVDAEVALLPTALPVELVDGSLSVDEVRRDHSIPLPLIASGMVSFTAETFRGDRLIVNGTGARSLPSGEPRYVENFPGSAEAGT